MFEFNDHEVMIFGGSGPIGRALQSLLPRAFAPSHEHLDLLYDVHRCRSWIEQLQPKVIFNLMGKTINMEGNIKYAADVFHANTIMHMNLLGICASLKVPKVVSVIPSCAYPDDEILREENFWSGKSHLSVESHGMARRNTLMYARQLHRQYNFNHIAIVLNNVMGPYDSFEEKKTKVVGGLINRFYHAKRDNLSEVVVWGDGTPLREFLYSGDAAEGLIRAANLYNDCMEPLNISRMQEISIKDLAFTIADYIGYRGNIKFDASRPSGQHRKLLNNTKMLKVLNGWSPPTSINEGIALTIDWYLGNVAK